MPASPPINHDQLEDVAVQGQIAHPVAHATPYRISHDGIPRVLPGTGGIVLNRPIGDLGGSCAAGPAHTRSELG